MIKQMRYGIFLGLIITSLAFGHAHPKLMSPASGAVISSKATTVSIIFNSQIEPTFSTINVINQKKQQVSTGKGIVDQGNPYLIKTQISALPAGKYQVNWSVVALDGHRTQGQYSFTVK